MSADLDTDTGDLVREVERWRKAAAAEADRADAAERRLADLMERVRGIVSAVTGAIEGLSAARQHLSGRGQRGPADILAEKSNRDTAG